jgi:2,3-bisphosphoglycerate-dependent phosphoglycerate mutase
MSQLILIRHGQSIWNQKNLFTGWVDVPLSAQGIEEALAAGKQLAEQPIEKVFVSTLMRAQQTATIAMSQHSSKKAAILQHDNDWTKSHSDETNQDTIPVYSDERLNERYYGQLQGMDKDQARAKYGEEQVHIWRRSYDVPPPEGESLEMTAARTLPCFDERIVPALEQEQGSILVSAHGNSLRSIIMKIEGLSSEEILSVEVPTGTPMFYEFDKGKFTKK